MIVLRYLYVLALVAWLGGMLTLALLVAPAVFAVLPAHEAMGGAALAGAVFGEILRTFHLGAYACGGVMLGTLFGMRVLGPKPVHFNARLVLVLAMLATAIYSGVSVSGRLERLPPSGAVSGRAVGAVHDSPFQRLHNLSTALMMVNVAGGLSLLYWEARE